MIYEKAWAKVFGTYQVLETTSIEQMLRDSTGFLFFYICLNYLLGAPCITYECKNMEEIWNILCEASAQGNIIIASTQEGNKKLRAEEIYKKGLNPLYGNTVLDVSLTRTSSEVRTIKLRNIWNSEYEWESKHK